MQTYVLILFLYGESHSIVPLIKCPLEVALSMSLYGAATKVCQELVCVPYAVLLLLLLVVQIIMAVVLILSTLFKTYTA